MKKGIIILGSSRSYGDTYKIAKYISDKCDFPIIDLKQKSIAEFDYDNNYDSGDEFMPIFRDIANNYEIILFATPVYWYNMSGIMKTFFDRISDTLKFEKDTGRKLRGKKMGVISCSFPDLVEGYYMPFKESADYLGMNYLADVHTWLTDGHIDTEVKTRLNQFISIIVEKN